MTQLPIADDVHAEAVQGSWCPKLCTFACPVTSATGHQQAVPWSFHRAVVDLVDGGLAPDDVGGRLDECSGCLACRDACAYDQDVPSQVLAGRALAPVDTPQARAALDHLAAGRRPDGTEPYPPVGAPDADVTLFVGCHDDADEVTAALALLTALGHQPRTVVADACCGGVARDLGDTDLADRLAADTAAAVGEATEVVAIDPHCQLDDVTVRPLVELLADAVERLAFRDDGDTAVVVHDPCLSVRRHGMVAAPRALLAAAGVTVVEPEGSGHDTVCSGAGMSLPLVDEQAASATATRRADLLGDGPVVTWCRRAMDRLAGVGTDVRSLLVLLADRLVEPDDDAPARHTPVSERNGDGGSRGVSPGGGASESSTPPRRGDPPASGRRAIEGAQDA